MKAYRTMTKEELTAAYDKEKAAFEELKGMGLKLNMARGKPERAQLDLRTAWIPSTATTPASTAPPGA